MKKTYYPVLTKIILSVLLVNVVAALAWPQKADTTADSQVSAGLHKKIIVIDPGHGGADPGATIDNLKEADLNMILSLVLKDELEKHGAIVKLTRHGNTGLVPEKTMTSYEQWYILQKRKAYAVREKCDILVSIHINSDKDSRVSGAMVFYSDDRSRKLAAILQENLNRLGLRPRKPVKSSFTVISKLHLPAVLIEAGFITNKTDRAVILEKPLIIAQLICNGILEYERIKQKDS